MSDSKTLPMSDEVEEFAREIARGIALSTNAILGERRICINRVIEGHSINVSITVSKAWSPTELKGRVMYCDFDDPRTYKANDEGRVSAMGVVIKDDENDDGWGGPFGH